VLRIPQHAVKFVRQYFLIKIRSFLVFLLNFGIFYGIIIHYQISILKLHIISQPSISHIDIF